MQLSSIGALVKNWKHTTKFRRQSPQSWSRFSANWASRCTCVQVDAVVFLWFHSSHHYNLNYIQFVCSQLLSSLCGFYLYTISCNFYWCCKLSEFSPWKCKSFTFNKKKKENKSSGANKKTLYQLSMGESWGWIKVGVQKRALSRFFALPAAAAAAPQKSRFSFKCVFTYMYKIFWGKFKGVFIWAVRGAPQVI